MKHIEQSWISSQARLFAEHFDLQYPGPEPGELDYLLRLISDGGEPVLELGCGTGRVLLPLRERGIDISGVDVSPAMLERCREKCKERGLDVPLYVQSMQELQIPKSFGTIFLGSCGLGVLASEDDARAALRRGFDHLQEHGLFSFGIQTPPPTKRVSERAGIWSGGWNVTEDGGILSRKMNYRYDEQTHVRESVIIFERFVAGELTATELQESTMRFWDAGTVARLLDEAGFSDVVTTRVFSYDDPAGDAEWLVVRARKA